jgi:predicted RNase H-like HicB family nuclease
MAGHQAGIVTFGKSFEEAFQVLMRVKANIALH